MIIITLWQKLNRINQLVITWIEWIGIGAFVFVLGIICADVLGAKLFGAPIFGSIDIVMLAQLVAISFASSMLVSLRRHIQVDFVVVFLPKRLRLAVECAIHFLSFGLFIIIVWRLFVHGYSFQSGGEVSTTAYIPLHPFVYSSALVLIPACLEYFRQFIGSFRKVISNES